jgi:hypothetical protein
VSYVDLNILLNLVVGVDEYEVSGFGELIMNQTCGQSKANLQ